MNVYQLITRSDTIGGAQVHLRSLCHLLKKDGHKVLVLAGGNGIFHDVLLDDEIKSIPLDYLKRDICLISDVQSILYLRKFLKNNKPDILAIHSAKSGLIGRIAALGLGIKVIYTVHGWSHIKNASRLSSDLYCWIDKILALITDEIICVSKSDVEFSINKMHINSEKVNLIYNGVAEYSLDVELKGKRINSSDVFKIICVTRFQEPKDNLSIIHAIKVLLTKSPFVKINVDFFGDGEELCSLKEVVRELELDEYVHFNGFSNDLISCYRQYDCFLLSSFSEGLPMSIIEAMSNKLPIIASDVGGISELVFDKYNGMKFTAGDIDGIVDSILFIMKLSADEYNNMSEASYKLYLRDFTIENMYSSTLSVYIGDNK
ncbi:glycosyltransferase family 4 protein [Vibrio cholerae]|nr:glycosyltransferase family 4 protein [Vibrio cholerae]